MSVDSETAGTRIVRPLRRLNLNALRTFATAETLDLAETIRLLLSYGTFKWQAGWRSDLGEDAHSVKLLSGGVDAIKALSDREQLPWDMMAAQLLAFATETWTAGWRKQNPGPLGPRGVDKYAADRARAATSGTVSAQAAPFDQARFAQYRAQYSGMKVLPAQTPLPRKA